MGSRTSKTTTKTSAKSTPVTSLTKSVNRFPVVGIGASAGGLDAFKRLLKAIPEDSGMAYVLVQHLDPSHESLLPEILQKVTSIPVREITDDIKVLSDHIYIIPSNKMLIANDGVLELSDRITKKGERNLPIDLFFKSLSEVHKAHAIGIVLSGTGSDGTIGLRAIKDNGGITFAQDEKSAVYGGMPESAVHADVVDFILPPESIPEKLLEVIRITRRNGDEENFQPQEEDVLKQLLLLLRVRKGTDFTYYKQSTIQRRILRRMALSKIDTPSEYLKHLREDKSEQDVLYQDILIPVTSFFRDPKTFDNLCHTVFPRLLDENNKIDTIRIWVAGCSTGEEVYSIAICIKEFLGEKQCRVQIFATDISEPAIAKARSGVYTKSELQEVSPSRLQEFFTKIEGGYQVNRNLRDMCVFAVHNFLKDPPFGKLDLISCRNVLIYMEPYLQKQALTSFHYGLNENGCLLLGKSETVSSLPDHFASVAKKDKLFIRKDVPGKFILTQSRQNEQSYAFTKPSKPESVHTDFQRTADELMLMRYTPAGVVINEAMDIVHFRGKTADYLEQSTGKPSLNLLKLAKNGLAFELRNILHKSKKNNASAIKSGIPIVSGGVQRLISIEAIPMPQMQEPYYLILFHEESDKSQESHQPSTRRKSAKGSIKKDDRDLRIEQLEKELAQIREDMRGITEAQEASNEELQSANEELVSSTEELQSLNEKLETGKEELQSTNEELTVLNEELLSANEQVTESRDYSEAIVSTVREPLLVLDKYLYVKTANPSFYRMFNVEESDTEGKLIFQLGNGQWDIPALRKLLEKILPEKSKFSEHQVTHTFRSIGKRTMILNAREIVQKNKQEKLILLAIEDITEKLDAQKLAEDAEVQFSLIADNISQLAWMADKEGLLYWYNKRWYDYTGKTLEQMKGSGWMSVHHPNHVERVVKSYQHSLDTGEKWEDTFPIRSKDGEYRWFLSRASAMCDEKGEIIRWFGTNTDITDLLNAEQKLRASEQNFHQLAELMPDMVSNADAQGHITYYNQSWLTYTGYTLEEMIALGWGKIIHPNDRQTVADRWKESLESGRDFEMELRLKDKDGKYKWHLCRSIPIKDDNEKIVRWIGTMTYIEEQRGQLTLLENLVAERTRELNNSVRHLEVKNRELESFAYVSSHDLQEPLRKIHMYAGRLLEKEEHNLSSTGKEYCVSMQRATVRMQTLINDLLSFSRLNAEERTFEKIDLTPILEQVTRELQDLHSEKNALIEIGAMPEIPVIPFQFRQLMLNLIGNALKFSKKDERPHIKIKSEIVGSDGKDAYKLPLGENYCHISISDNGIGFEEEYGERIFKVFQKLHGKEVYSGTGIGLAIVKKIVENHNGHISATSKLGKGATFDIYLPA